MPATGDKPKPRSTAAPLYTVGEEIASAVTHGLGAMLSVAGLTLLIVKVVLTGGGSGYVLPLLRRRVHHEPNLQLLGLRELYYKNR